MIKRPQKAPSESITDKELEDLNYPVFGSPKLDGFRCTTNNAAHTSSMKLVKNKYVQNILSDPKYTGLDGELVVGPPNHIDAYNHTTGPMRRLNGEPDFKFYVFDSLLNITAPYGVRKESLLVQTMNLPFVVVLTQDILHSPKDVIKYTDWCVMQGFEGAMIRNPNGLYKEGRCTHKEGNIFKRKPFVDDEATIVGFVEQQENLNKVSVNELGLAFRSSHKRNKTGKGTLGAFVLKSNKWEGTFNCGTGKGLNDKLRQWIWNNQDKCLGKTIVYKFQEHGSIEAPRIPIYKGFRDKADMTDY